MSVKPLSAPCPAPHWTDTHVHLDAAEFDADRDAVIERSRAVGVSSWIIPAVSVSNFSTVQQLARHTPGAAYALGIHPLYVADASEQDLVVLREQLLAALPDPKLVAVGEIGLDFFDERATAHAEKQEKFYVAQLALAAELGLPVLLHVRRSQDRLLKYLRRLPRIGGLAHAFNGSQQQAEQFIAQGFKLGLGGTLTFAASKQIRRLATGLPLENLVLETDAPDIAPSWVRPGRNEPAHLARIAEQLAQLRGMVLADLAQAMQLNVEAALPRLKLALATGVNPS